MITRDEFLKAKEIVDQYINQCKDDINSTTISFDVTDIRDMRIQDCSNKDVSIRFFNVLAYESESHFGKKINELQVKDLARLPLSTYKRFRNFGKKSEGELMELLAKAQLYINP